MGSEYRTVTEVQTVPLVSKRDAYEFAHRKTMLSTHGRATEFMQQMAMFKKQYRTHFRANSVTRLGFAPASNAGRSNTIDEFKLQLHIEDIENNLVPGSIVHNNATPTPTLYERVWYTATNGRFDAGMTYSGLAFSDSVSNVFEQDPVANTLKVDIFNSYVNNIYPAYVANEVMTSADTLEFDYLKISDNSVIAHVKHINFTFDSDSLVVQYLVNDGYGNVERYIIAEHGELDIYVNEDVDIMPIVPLKEWNLVKGIKDGEVVNNPEADIYYKKISDAHDDRVGELETDYLSLIAGYGDGTPRDNKVYKYLDISAPEFEGDDKEFKDSLKDLYYRKYDTDVYNGVFFEEDRISDTDATKDFMDAYKLKKTEYENDVKIAKKNYIDNGGAKLERNHKRFMRSINLDYDDFKKTIGNEDLDCLYITIGVNMLSEYEAAMKIIYDYFIKFNLGNQIVKHSGLEVSYEYNATVGTQAGKLIPELDYEFHLEEAPEGTSNGVTSIKLLTGTAIEKDEMEIKLIKDGWIYEDTFKSDYGYIRGKRSWKQKGWITELKLVDRVTEPVEVGVVEQKDVGRHASWIEDTSFSDETGGTITVKVLKYYKQINTSTVAYLYLSNFTQTYKFGELTPAPGETSHSREEKSDINQPDKAEFEGFRVIPHIDALRRMKYKDFQAVYEESLMMLVYTYTKTELKWYQTSWFKTVITIASLVAVVYSLGTASSLLSMAQSMLQGALIAYAVSEIATSIGGEMGIALGAAAGVAMAAYAPGSAITLESTLMASLQYMSIAMKAETVSIINDMRSMIEGYDEKMDDIRRKMDELPGNGMLGTDDIAEIMREWNEDTSDYFTTINALNPRIYNPYETIAMARSIQPLLDAAYAPLNLDSMRNIKIV